ncbi:MAG: YajQ family cyclic di-GMP-binding protein [Leptospiraceae bacterium]|nr:YajQ family cyclic di-GMP-binding protein [Leptospiraceae bacterium]
MADISFDIVSELNQQELANAVDQTKREIATRFDFKGTKVKVETEKEDVILFADDENKLKQLQDVFESKLIKRGIELKAVNYGKIEAAALGTVRCRTSFSAGVNPEVAKKIHNIIKESKIKVKSQTMDQKVRVTGKSRDELQEVIKLLKNSKIEIPLQFNNYR